MASLQIKRFPLDLLRLLKAEAARSGITLRQHVINILSAEITE